MQRWICHLQSANFFFFFYLRSNLDFSVFRRLALGYLCVREKTWSWVCSTSQLFRPVKMWKHILTSLKMNPFSAVRELLYYYKYCTLPVLIDCSGHSITKAIPQLHISRLEYQYTATIKQFHYFLYLLINSIASISMFAELALIMFSWFLQLTDICSFSHR